MADKARFAFGSKAGVAAAIQRGDVDAYDFLCLSGENENPSLGWVDKNNNPVYVECIKYIDVVTALPETGEEGIIYMLEGKGYVWYNSAFVPMAESVDLSALQEQINAKIDASEVETLIDTRIEEKLVEVNTGYEIVEF